MDVAAALQHALERNLLHVLTEYRRGTGRAGCAWPAGSR